MLHCRDKADPQAYFELTQEPGRSLRLSLPPADKPRVLEAPTVWHLLIVHGDECRKGLLPRLEALRPDWRIESTLTAAEEELVKLAAGAEKPDRQQWAAWVNQLGDPLCTRRERAERKLREAGPAVLAFLNRLNTAPLDAEQQLRVRRVIQALSAQQGEDTPENIAAAFDRRSAGLAGALVAQRPGGAAGGGEAIGIGSERAGEDRSQSGPGEPNKGPRRNPAADRKAFHETISGEKGSRGEREGSEISLSPPLPFPPSPFFSLTRAIQ